MGKGQGRGGRRSGWGWRGCLGYNRRRVRGRYGYLIMMSFWFVGGIWIGFGGRRDMRMGRLLSVEFLVPLLVVSMRGMMRGRCWRGMFGMLRVRGRNRLWRVTAGAAF